MSEACEKLDLEAHTLRYWEKEFEELDPAKTPGGQRRYRKSDIQLLKRIKNLIRNEKYTVAGARQQLAKREGKRADITARKQIRELAIQGIEEINSFMENEL